MRDLHLMIDIETVSSQTDAAVASIGAVAFEPHGQDSEAGLRSRPEHLFYVPIDLEDNEALGRHFSGDTIKWWLRQEEAARAALVDPDAVTLKEAAQRLRTFVEGLTPRPTRVWAKGPDFDCVILKHVFNQVGESWPFQYSEARCVRTIAELAFPAGDAPRMNTGTAHNALDDAIFQACLVQLCQRRLAPSERSPLEELSL